MYSDIHNAIEQMEKALDEGDIQLAKRYLSKLREQYFCMRCKEPIFRDHDDVVPYFKGWKHVKECPRNAWKQ